jgi:UDP-N-acetylglucosamine--N-acetylmuramyl-(pentapeptide) pyrophosphoryl-undecaprenol N-acetylglucosamine transferase
VPSPNVSEDHQTKNALAVVGENAAILLREREQALFQTKLENLLGDENLQRTLSENIQKLALPNATKDIVDLVEELIEKKKRKTQNERP